MNQQTTRLGTLLPKALVLLGTLLLAPAAMAADAEITVVTVQASGAPTGSPEIDPELKDLPGIATLCIRFAKCGHEATARKKLDWGETGTLGTESSRVEVTVEAPQDVDGKQVMKIALVAYKGDKPCSRAKAAVSPRSAASVACDDHDSQVQYLHVVMARPL